jgi:hypothetical protein
VVDAEHGVDVAVVAHAEAAGRVTLEVCVDAWKGEVRLNHQVGLLVDVAIGIADVPVQAVEVAGHVAAGARHVAAGRCE